MYFWSGCVYEYLQKWACMNVDYEAKKKTKIKKYSHVIVGQISGISNECSMRFPRQLNILLFLLLRDCLKLTDHSIVVQPKCNL